MNDVDRNAPEIRFPGFTEPWEQRKLPEFVTFYNGLTYTPDDVRDEGTLVLRSSNVKNGSVVDADNVYVDPNKANSENVKDGDIIVVVRNGSRALIGKHAEIKGTMPNTVIGAFMTGIRSDYPSFVNALLDTPQFDKEIEKNMGATINQITGYMFSKMEFYIPSSPDEQKQIGALFRSLDNAITLHQRKCDELIIFKNGLLQKLFPLHEELYPSVRLHSFDGPWKLRKFEDIFTVSQGLQIPISERYTEPGENRYFYITNEFLKASCKEAYYIESPSESVLCDEDDILMTRTGNTGIVVTDVSGCFHNNFFKIAYDKQTYSKRFICYMLSSPAMHRVIMNNAGSSTIPDLSHKNFYRIEAAFPDSKEEQEQIGKLLFMLDKLINLQQLKCDELKLYKKGLLQKMFI